MQVADRPPCPAGADKITAIWLCCCVEMGCTEIWKGATHFQSSQHVHKDARWATASVSTMYSHTRCRPGRSSSDNPRNSAHVGKIHMPFATMKVRQHNDVHLMLPTVPHARCAHTTQRMRCCCKIAAHRRPARTMNQCSHCRETAQHLASRTERTVSSLALAKPARLTTTSARE